MQFIEYNETYQLRVAELITGIQQQELRISITMEDQPDLKTVDSFYKTGNGNFWLALHGDNVVGTIALVDIGDSRVALRKMFVHSDFRGANKGVAKQLMQIVMDHCRNKGVKDIYLGTIASMKAAHRFYEKNGFYLVSKEQLPGKFPLMAVDNLFYRFSVNDISAGDANLNDLKTEP